MDKMTRPQDLPTVLPPLVQKGQCECGQLVLAGFGYYDPHTEKAITHCPFCQKELSMMTVKRVKE